MLGACNSSAKTYVFGDEVACVMRSAAPRAEFADFANKTKGSRALVALNCSMITLILLFSACQFGGITHGGEYWRWI